MLSPAWWVVFAITLCSAFELAPRAPGVVRHLRDSWGTLSAWEQAELMVPFLVTLAFALYLCEQAGQWWKLRRRNQDVDLTTLPVFGLRDLEEYNGRDSARVYCSVRGRVYDVSTSNSIQPNGGYAFLCGADATFGIARMSFDDDLVGRMDFGTLTADEWASVNGWVGYMDGKYEVVGRLQEYYEWRAAMVEAAAEAGGDAGSAPGLGAPELIAPSRTIPTLPPAPSQATKRRPPPLPKSTHPAGAPGSSGDGGTGGGGGRGGEGGASSAAVADTLDRNRRTGGSIGDHFMSAAEDLKAEAAYRRKAHTDG